MCECMSRLFPYASCLHVRWVIKKWNLIFIYFYIDWYLLRPFYAVSLQLTISQRIEIHKWQKKKKYRIFSSYRCLIPKFNNFSSHLLCVLFFFSFFYVEILVFSFNTQISLLLFRNWYSSLINTTCTRQEYIPFIAESWNKIKFDDIAILPPFIFLFILAKKCVLHYLQDNSIKCPLKLGI